MTATAVAIRHIHFEGLGTLEPLLRARGYDVRYVEAPVADLAEVEALDPDLLIVLGGPIGATDDHAYPFLADEVALLHRRLNSNRPILGICLGAQLIARAMGAQVCAMGTKEIGFSPLRLTELGKQSPLHLLGDTPVLHWHGDQFDIPLGAKRLAQTAKCKNQAFSMGDGVLGLQFHLEADTLQIEHWLVGHAVELSLARIDPWSIRATAQQIEERLLLASNAVFNAWLDRIESK